MLIPALDLIDGQIVRLKQGDFDQKTVFDLDPVTKVKEYCAQGAALIHLVDLDGAKDPKERQLGLIAELVAASSCPIQTGGGIRSYHDVEELLELGVSRVVVGSAAIKDPALGLKLLTEFGPDAITLALDVKLIDGVPMVATHGWLKVSDNSVYDLLAQFSSAGLKHVLITDIAKDGMMQGPNSELYAQIHHHYPKLDLIASGGISSLDDLKTLKNLGIPSAVLGKSLLTGAFTLPEALALWPND